ncbi:conserved protein, unknown function [Babesia microti strain RI]|uniref:PRKR-interacting protein 1 n=1 Tax=Babesia microti (strain RI) TaxID=1133968 RepID=A0A1R4AB26_BABMR|nr:conserved protein, unknown function [Babesia microti strain RI]SJK86209.1 conserved protein, unknown function [Babesia microti strain RI]|eukprot:XP_021338397.1 conserved protein, unknown function [Babesia microti strain RI]
MADSLILSDGRVVNVSSEIKVEPVKEKFMPKRPRDVFAHIGAERIVNIWGSASGAGSDFFDIYRKHRAREMDRVEQLEKDFQESLENKIFQAKREERINKLLAKTAKKRYKRKRREMKKKGLLTDNIREEHNEQSPDGEEDYHESTEETSIGNVEMTLPEKIIQTKRPSTITVEADPDF